MNGDEQLEVLARTPDLEPFRLRLDRDGKAPLQAVAPTILQMNVCRRCNLNCKHCHVKAGPDRAEAMSRKTMERCLEVARHPS
ncbi:MAG: radical SAM protein, partial [Methanopyri archaeon]|nr:radical SAM protein [Methanopyri archaeon]